MKTNALLVVAGIAATVWVTLAVSGQDADRTGGLRELEWLAGSWYGTIDGGHWEACYTTAEGGEIISANKEIRGGKVAMIEFERFTRDGDKIIMTPYPHGKRSSVSFTMVSHDIAEKRAVFTNPEHDFPSRIVYHRAAADNLVCEISGKPASAREPITVRLDLKRR